MTNFERASRIASLSPENAPSTDVQTLAALWPALQRMASDGANVVIKLDGGRTGDAVPKPYTVVVSGGKLAEDFFRQDAETLDAALSAAVLFYNEKIWKAEVRD